MLKRIFSLLLALCFLFGVVPLSLATNDTGTDYGYTYVDSDTPPVTITGDEAKAKYEEALARITPIENGRVIAPITYGAGDYDVLNITQKTYATVPQLDSVFTISEYALYRLLTGATEVHFTTTLKLNNTQFNQIYTLAYTYFPHWYSLGASYAGNDYILHFSVNQGLLTAERQAAKTLADKYRSQGLTETQILKAAHDDIVNMVTYYQDTAHKGQFAYCALVEKKGVCAAYANAYALVCQYAGIRVAGFSGQAGEAHRWNMVYIGSDEGRIVDATWDDQSSVIYNYYMKSKAEYLTTNGDTNFGRTWDSAQDLFVDYLHKGGNGAAGGGGVPELPDTSSGVLVTGKYKDGSASSLQIDFVSETVVSTEGDVTGYLISKDGGKKWSKLKTPSISSAIGSKAIEIVLAKSSDGKKPTAGTEVYFGQVAARDKVMLVADFDSKGQNIFYVKDKKGAALPGFFYTTSKERNLTVADFMPVPEDGIPISSEKMEIKVVSAPTMAGDVVTPRSAIKAFKLIKGKSPKLKIDYKKETLKLKENMVYRVNGGEISDPVTKDEAKIPFDVSDMITNGGTLEVFVVSAGSKAGTDLYTISDDYSGDNQKGQQLLPRAVAPATMTSLTKDTKGKWKCTDRTLEFLSPNSTKWGTINKTFGDGALVRVKATKTTAASIPQEIDISDAGVSLLPYNPTEDAGI